MPKKFSKNFNSLKNDFYRVAKYHWEFMRRNEDLRQKLPKNTPFDPELDFEKLLEKLMENLDLEGASDYEKRSFIIFGLVETFSAGVKYKIKQGYPPRMTIVINFNKINRISKLREYLGLLIEGYCNEYPRLFREAYGIERSERRAFNLNRKEGDRFERILKVGDLYEELKRKLTRQPGIYKQIAEKIFPRSDYPNYYEEYDECVKLEPPIKKSALDEAEKIVKEYKRLVNGGYGEITYP